MTRIMNRDLCILRDLAKQYKELTARPEQDERRTLWRRHNSLKGDRPLIYIRAYAWKELPVSNCKCQDSLLRKYENILRYNLFWSTFNDDSIFEPWITVNAAYLSEGWGVQGERHFADEAAGSWKTDYPIKNLENIDLLREPVHQIDEQRTHEEYERIQDALGNILTVNLDRGPAYRMWTGDLSTDLGYLRGIEHFMLDMMDNPDWLHRLVSRLANGVLKTHQEAEAAGDWGLSCHQNQAMPYAEELPDPKANVHGVNRSDLWGFMAAQEFTAVSPNMHDEFMLQYQLPILKEFGLVAYGCCEDLTLKIDMLRRIPNLRRIAVSPFADVPRCAEQIGRDYVFSYRPSPADMVSFGLDEEQIRAILTRDLLACRDCRVDITLKDVETIQGDPSRIHTFVRVAREVIDTVFR
jgi:hypothetical protein